MTDRRQTDGRQHIANVNVSWRSLKVEMVQDRDIVTRGSDVCSVQQRYIWRRRVSLKVIHLSQIFSSVIFHTVVQQLTRFQLRQSVAWSLCDRRATCVTELWIGGTPHSVSTVSDTAGWDLWKLAPVIIHRGSVLGGPAWWGEIPQRQTHRHPFNGLFSRTTWVSWHQGD